jgi:hypothetical protein
VVELPRGPETWLVLRHGSGLLSYYLGFAKLNPALVEGGPVAAGEVLGFAATSDSLAGSGASAPPMPLRFRVERSGSPEDPLAFLGLSAAAPDAHAP